MTTNQNNYINQLTQILCIILLCIVVSIPAFAQNFYSASYYNNHYSILSSSSFQSRATVDKGALCVYIVDLQSVAGGVTYNHQSSISQNAAHFGEQILNFYTDLYTPLYERSYGGDGVVCDIPSVSTYKNAFIGGRAYIYKPFINNVQFTHNRRTIDALFTLNTTPSEVFPASTIKNEISSINNKRNVFGGMDQDPGYRDQESPTGESYILILFAILVAVRIFYKQYIANPLSSKKNIH